MKKNYTIILAFLCCMMACIPGQYEYEDPGFTSMDSVSVMKLRANHYQLMADGKGEIELTPALFMKSGFQIVDDRTDFSQLEYYTISGEKFPKTYSTSDKSLIGDTIKVYAKIKGRDLISDTTSFTIVDPSTVETWKEITMPVIFHVVQTDEEVKSYGGEIPIETILRAFDKINNSFSGTLSKNPAGVDTKIKFKLALYDPYGNELSTPGINRIFPGNIIGEDKDKYAEFIRSQDLLWNPDQYLNIWLISDYSGAVTDFSRNITQKCIPLYVNQGVDPKNLEGGNLKVQPAAWNPAPFEVGIIYCLQPLLSLQAFPYNSKNNELVNAVGCYLGLLSTFDTYSVSRPKDDYCKDTPYYFHSGGYKGNYGLYKMSDNKYFYMSENIMDDPAGVHRSVTLEQTLRMRWVLENCAGRGAWKSDSALTGK